MTARLPIAGPLAARQGRADRPRRSAGRGLHARGRRSGLTQTLADFGAEVIKIENPEGGDDTRAYRACGIGGESAAYISLNATSAGSRLILPSLCARRGKRADREGRRGRREFFERRHEKFASTTTPLRGESRLVYCSISAYGRKGPFASRTGFDPITQAESGFMS